MLAGMVFRRCLAGLALASALVGCGWRGPATITLKDGSVVRCPDLFVAKAYVSCEGLESGERIYPINTVASVSELN
jgi:hypothetical protein